ncbi:TIR domain-containing protein [Dorea sp.]|uniref:TIR domain-containing protein n=1 Tax=Dorea sp. TaxID=2040332 RepID=UPI003529A1E0
MILKILEDTEGIQPVKEMEEVSKRKDISTWIDEKIQSTSVTILLLNKEISNSNWVEREINKSIEANNKFVLIDISNNTYDKEFVGKFKIGSKCLNEVYKVHSIQNIEEEGSFGEIGQWVRSVVNKA